MGQRHSEYERKASDFYPTPEWVTEAVLPHLPLNRGDVVWEPAAGDGRMVEVVRAAYPDCEYIATDIEPRAPWIGSCDFLSGSLPPLAANVDFVITNPPFGRDAVRFIERSLDATEGRRGGVAMLLRSQFHHAKGYRHVFGGHPAHAKILALTRRIVWFVDPDTGKPKAAPSDTHCWHIWDWRHVGPAKIAYGPDTFQEAAE